MDLFRSSVFAIVVGLLFADRTAAQSRKTSVVVYDGDSCDEPAATVAFTSEFMCNPQEDHWHPVCVTNESISSVSDCTKYYSNGYDELGILTDAFGQHPYLFVEQYAAGRCGFQDALQNVMAYLLDEKCHANPKGTASTRLTLGHSVIITTYEDAQCANVASQTTVGVVDVGVSAYGWCGSQNTKVYLGGATLNLTAVAFYGDSTCSGPPLKLTLSQDFACAPQLDPNNRTCEFHDTHFSVSDCVPDYGVFAATAFGPNTPYLMVVEFTHMYCGQVVESVKVYPADGFCRFSPDDATTFRATLRADGTATITTYSDKTCSVVASDVNVDKQDLASSTCVQHSDCGRAYPGCGRKFFVGGLGGPPSMGKKTAVVVYDGDSCDQPAATVTFTSELMCKPQEDHWHPVCVTNGSISSVSDCTTYYNAGYDEFGILTDAFSQHPYLFVEQYDEGKCGNRDALQNVMAYVLDEKCHANPAGTASTRLTLGHSVTIATYGDAQCANIASQTSVGVVDVGLTNYGWCVDQIRRVYLGGATLKLTTVAVYEDDTCSGVPVKIMLSQDFACTPQLDPAIKTCNAHGSTHFSVSDCTLDYGTFAATAFGPNTPYLMVAEFTHMYCGQVVEYATVYPADGVCHAGPDDETSFRAILRADGTATITTYSDTSCGFTATEMNADKQVLASSMCVQHDGCGRSYPGCGRKFVVGGLGGPPSMGKKTAVVVYDGDSCDQHAVTVAFTSELMCNPQEDHWHPVCVTNGSISSVSDCTKYYSNGYDELGILTDAFDQHPYLFVEQYAAGRCGFQDALQNVMAYLLDEKCHANPKGTASTRLTLGHSVIITTYEDAQCANVASQTTVGVVDVGVSAYGWCGSQNTKVYLGGATLNLTAVAFYGDSTCSGPPLKLTLSQDFACAPQLDLNNRTCEFHGTHFSVSDCVPDYGVFAATAFGPNTPYLMVAEFTHMYCGQVVESVKVYPADGVCHADPGNATSFRAILRADGTATITLYSDTSCSFTVTEMNADKQTLASSMCVQHSDCGRSYPGCGRRFSVGGLGGPPSTRKKTAITLYDGSSCTGAPVQLTVSNQVSCVPPSSPICESVSVGGQMVYQALNCIDDYVAFAKSKFSDSSYLIVEKYADGTNCSTQDNVTVYLADGGCHPSISGDAAFKITRYADGVVTIATYPTVSCDDLDAEYTTVNSKFINTAACYKGNINLYASTPPTPTTTAPTTTAPPTTAPPTTAWPTTAWPTPTTAPATKAPTTKVPIDADQKTREQILFPAWLWKPKGPRVFLSG
ncbi:hypothetical protein BBJ28_00006625 [Nothophytophthora sp. Chile5]|nr:hypothetical protein BBJ28_00006625 [Nothophytophthora sp. Chile5]